MSRTQGQYAKLKRIIWRYYRLHGRRMPWRTTRDPYRILVSEIMLQQTQVDRVLAKYAGFIKAFPDFATLARASVTDVLRVWQGLGYNRRALFLHRIAGEVISRHHGRLPRNPAVLQKLPGIGAGTAGAIAAFAFEQPVVFIETNIRRVYIHFFFPLKKKRRRRNIGTGTTGIGDKEILSLLERSVDKKNPREWYYALMDYGAMLGREKGRTNANRLSKSYTIQSRFEGSNRQLRGRIVAAMLAEPFLTASTLAKRLKTPLAKIKSVSSALKKEGLVV